MRIRSILCVVVLILLSAAGYGQAQSGSVAEQLEFRVPMPAAVGTREHKVGFEITPPTGWPTILKAADGRLMMVGGGRIRYSKDGGRIWETGVQGVPVAYAIRLKSGKLAGLSGQNFYLSEDEGKTWQKQDETPQGANAGGPYPNTLFQTRTGQLMLPTRSTHSGHQGLYDSSGSWGTLGNKLVHTEGHAHFPETDMGYMCRSVDEGKHWSRSNGSILIWHKNGVGGMWPCDEPSVVDGRNGDIYMLMRTTLGRIYISRSGPVNYYNARGQNITYPAGVNFDYPQPTSLAGSYSPCAITVLKNDDWLIVWNQVSGDEIRAGYRRGRLSSAISKDDGKTWEHHRTIDSVVLPPAGRVEPDAEPRMARGLDYVGIMPDDFGSVSYSCLSVVDDQVFIFYSRVVVRPRSGDVAGRRMRVLPLSWFYQEQPPLKPGPRLVIQTPSADGRNWNTHDVPSIYDNGRFHINSKDVQTFLKSSMGRLGANIQAPLHQVITCLGWKPGYDRSHMDDADDPRLLVRCNHLYSAPMTEYIIEHNPANSDVWGHRNGSIFIGRLNVDVAADQYSYNRIGKYDAAQSFELDKPTKVVGIDVFLGGGSGCKYPVVMTLCEDKDGKPSSKLIADGARATMAKAGSVNGFEMFRFAKPISVAPKQRVWMVLTKKDESGDGPMYAVLISSHDGDKARDWYGRGDFAGRGPYAVEGKPGGWSVRSKQDIYFKIVGVIQ